MVVDDDDDILDVISVILEIHGYEAITISTGKNLIEKVKEFKPKVILLDVQLGNLEGRFLCKEIKQIEEHATIPIILFSANIAYVKDEKEYLCDDFIAKPFEVVSLIEMIKRYSNILN